jgi:hypothetical protein
MTMVTARQYFNAPAGWTNLTATAPFTAYLGLNVRIICVSGQGRVVWGGTTAPVNGVGIPLEAESSDFDTAVAQVWLFGPATYNIDQY